MRWRYLWLVLSALPPVAWLGAVLATTVPRVSEAGLRRRVEREVPPGTPREEVAAWLRCNGDPPLDGYDYGPGGRDVVYIDEAAGTMSGGFAKHYVTLFRGPTMIRVTFSFDRRGRRADALEVSEYVYDH
jgi:hypothetical protein